MGGQACILYEAAEFSRDADRSRKYHAKQNGAKIAPFLSTRNGTETGNPRLPSCAPPTRLRMRSL